MVLKRKYKNKTKKKNNVVKSENDLIKYQVKANKKKKLVNNS